MDKIEETLRHLALSALGPEGTPPGPSFGLAATHATWRPLRVLTPDELAEEPWATGVWRQAHRALKSRFVIDISASFLREGSAMFPDATTGPFCFEQITCLDAKCHFALARHDGEEAFFIFIGNTKVCLGIYFIHRAILLPRLNDLQRVLSAIAIFDSVLVSRLDQVLDHFNNPKRSNSALIVNGHIGHHLWNELGALDFFRARGLLQDLHTVFVQPGPTEAYHRLDRIFPELEDHVKYPENMEDLIANVLNQPARIVPIGSNFISAHLADRLVDLSIADASDFLQTLDAIEGERSLRCLIGLRVENRCWVDQDRGFLELARQLSAAYGHVTLIFDGHNIHHDEDRGAIFSYRERGSAARGMDASATVTEERRIVRFIEEGINASGLSDRVKIASTIMMPVWASIAAARWADFFITQWGAGLAKYKWVANRHGIICSNRTMLDEQTVRSASLKIYEENQYRENVVKSTFVPIDFIVDLPYPERQLMPFPASFANCFEMDPHKFSLFAVNWVAENLLSDRASLSNST